MYNTYNILKVLQPAWIQSVIHLLCIHTPMNVHLTGNRNSVGRNSWLAPCLAQHLEHWWVHTKAPKKIHRLDESKREWTAMLGLLNSHPNTDIINSCWPLSKAGRRHYQRSQLNQTQNYLTIRAPWIIITCVHVHLTLGRQACFLFLYYPSLHMEESRHSPGQTEGDLKHLENQIYNIHKESHANSLGWFSHESVSGHGSRGANITGSETYYWLRSELFLGVRSCNEQLRGGYEKVLWSPC